MGYEARVATSDDGTTSDAGSVDIELRNSRSGQRMTFSMDAFTGGHLLHLAIAGCVYNDLYREALSRGITLTHVAVTADGDFGGDPCVSTGVEYQVELEGDASTDDLDQLLSYVEQIAEIPSALRLGGSVRLTSRIVTPVTADPPAIDGPSSDRPGSDRQT